jgi:hypothetical protein
MQRIRGRNERLDRFAIYSRFKNVESKGVGRDGTRVSYKNN